MHLPISIAIEPRKLLDRIPKSLIAGPALIAVSWPTAWFGPKPYSEHTFFPLWLGYILTADGLTNYRTGSSLLARSREQFALLFAASVPAWWMFEAANRRLQNWHYVQPRPISKTQYILESTLCFSTVIPAIFETAELYRTLPPFRRAREWARIHLSRKQLVAVSAVAVAAGVVGLTYPHQGFPLAWTVVFFVLDPLNALAGQKSIAAAVAQGRWDTVLVLFAAGITCGGFWETWNYYSLPKWIYTVPYVGQPKIFEMPVLGFGGYLPFALELYALYQTLHGLIFRRPDTYLRFDLAADEKCPV